MQSVSQLAHKSITTRRMPLSRALGDIRVGRVTVASHRIVFIRYSKLAMDISGLLPKEALPASTVTSSLSSARKQSRRSPATIRAALPKIETVLFGLELQTAFCDMSVAHSIVT